MKFDMMMFWEKFGFWFYFSTKTTEIVFRFLQNVNHFLLLKC